MTCMYVLCFVCHVYCVLCLTTRTCLLSQKKIKVKPQIIVFSLRWACSTVSVLLFYLVAFRVTVFFCCVFNEKVDQCKGQHFSLLIRYSTGEKRIIFVLFFFFPERVIVGVILEVVYHAELSPPPPPPPPPPPLRPP
jgi:hypothetical protein